jgi:transposase
MYLRHDVIKKDGKTHTYWRLVKSVRVGAKVRQKTVAQLGELDEKGRLRAQALARQLGGQQEPPGLFDQPMEKEVAEVRLNGVRLERTKRFGDVWLAQKLWRMAKLDVFFDKAFSVGKEEISWGVMAELLVVARLCEPSSELHIAEDWLRKTALPELLGIPEEKINDDRLYRALDEILPHKEALEKHLKDLWEGLFQVKYDLLLYDITSTYFEGTMAGNPEAQRGHSRDHRSDCKQVCIGLIVTREGIPLGYEVFAGNMSDSKTVKGIVATIESRYGKADRVWVKDRGMVSEAIIDWMREGGRRYVVGTPKSEIKKHESLLREAQGWKKMVNGVEIRFASSLENADVYLICRSEDRRKKEHAIHSLFEKRIEASLQRIERRVAKSKKPLSQAVLERQVGRMLQRNQRSGRLFQIAFEKTADSPSGLRLKWEKDEAEKLWQEISEGCYVLQTNIKSWTEVEVWSTYIQLTQAEAAFRTEKSELNLRPIHHQKQERTRAHILVCFLAYVLWKFLEQWQSRAGLGNSPRTILEELGHIQSGDVVLPTTTGEVVKLRCVVQPEKAQQIILQRLGITLPRRMRAPDYMKKM